MARVGVETVQEVLSMTLRERVIIEVYTGYCMTSGEERKEVYKYMSELMGRPVYTHELANKSIQDELHKRAQLDFISLCTDGWIYCSDRLPTREECQKNDNRFIVTDGNRTYTRDFDYIEKCFCQPYVSNTFNTYYDRCVIAWQPLPEVCRNVATEQEV